MISLILGFVYGFNFDKIPGAKDLPLWMKLLLLLAGGVIISLVCRSLHLP